MRKWQVWDFWSYRHRSCAHLRRRVQEIISYHPENSRENFMHCHRHHSSTSSFWWYPDLINISRSHLVSVMRMPEPTVHRESSISWILRWVLPHRKMYLQLVKKFFRLYLKSSHRKEALWLRLHIRLSVISRQCWSLVPISRICVTRFVLSMWPTFSRNVRSSRSSEKRFGQSAYTPICPKVSTRNSLNLQPDLAWVV